MRRKYSILFSLLSILFFQFVSAESIFINDDQYIYFRWQTCSHCAKVEQYRETTQVDDHMHLTKKEVQTNRINASEMLMLWEKLWIDTKKIWTPMLIIIHSDGTQEAVIWDVSIIELTDELESQWLSMDLSNIQWNDSLFTWITDQDIKDSTNDETVSLWERLKFFAIMMPAALSDSINPCAFAVMLLLLTAILSKTKNKKTALLSGLAFSLAVFVTYFLLWVWVLKLLWNMKSLVILKRIVWIVWILVWLANLKDFFRYWKGFVMEVPKSWRPAMAKIIKKVTSPWWAFLIWVVISLFLLPCSSGPYLTILWFLSAESQTLTTRWYIYLTVYNLIFVLPMLIIALIVWLWYSTAEKIWAFKNKNTRLIHLIVWLLMIWLWIYVLGTLYWW